MKKFQVIMIMLLLSTIFSSCAGFGHRNFSKQKYTQLKTHRADRHEPEVYTKSAQAAPDSAGGGKVSYMTYLHETDFVLDVASCNGVVPEKNTPPENERFVWEDSLTNSKHTNKDGLKTILPDDPKGRFDMIFQVGFMMILLGFLLTFMAITASSALMLWFCVLVGGGLIIAAWILSFYAIRSARKVPEQDRNNAYKLKNGLSWLVHVIGWVVLVVNVIFWCVALLLFL